MSYYTYVYIYVYIYIYIYSIIPILQGGWGPPKLCMLGFQVLRGLGFRGLGLGEFRVEGL